MNINIVSLWLALPSVDLSGMFELEGLFTGFAQIGIALLLIVSLITAMELALGRMPLVSSILGRLREA
ncbi:MAG: hypothetical protein ACXADY_26865 [Candidatus Hodarchaeales archaeon]|jgi:hypothetical protein